MQYQNPPLQRQAGLMNVIEDYEDDEDDGEYNVAMFKDLHDNDNITITWNRHNRMAYIHSTNDPERQSCGDRTISETIRWAMGRDREHLPYSLIDFYILHNERLDADGDEEIEFPDNGQILDILQQRWADYAVNKIQIGFKIRQNGLPARVAE
jgi:hypothetical protein